MLSAALSQSQPTKAILPQEHSDPRSFAAFAQSGGETVLQVCCSVLQGVTGVLRYVAGCYRVLVRGWQPVHSLAARRCCRCVACVLQVCCSFFVVCVAGVLQYVAGCDSVLLSVWQSLHTLAARLCCRCVAVCCRCVAGVLQGITVCYWEFDGLYTVWWRDCCRYVASVLQVCCKCVASVLQVCCRV